MDSSSRNVLVAGEGERLTLTRAGLVQAGAAAAVVIAAPSVSRSLAPALKSMLAGRGATAPLAYLRRATYVPLVGDSFEIARADGSRVKLRLIEARPIPSRGEAFSLVFQGSEGTVLESAIHRLEHPGLGAVELFLGPVGPTLGRRQFEAVVNRIRRH